MAVAAVLPVRLAWVADPDPGAAALLAHHHPDVPNLGDITETDWTQVEPVDVLTAGFPCQDLSYAGRGAGIRKGTRSGLWHTIADAVSVLRPRLIVLENVRAIVSRRPGLDVVLADLAALGFDAEWTCIRASDVGAGHERRRWFLLAWPADAPSPRFQGPRLPRRVAGRGGIAPHPADLGHKRGGLAWGRRPGPADGGVAAADATSDGRNKRRTGPTRQQGRPDAALGGRAVADSDCGPVRQQPVAESGRCGTTVAELAGVWGRYAPAISRWEHVTGRAAPHPVGPTAKGGEGLSPVFVEWLMGLPAGHVTAVPGLTRNQQLKLLGNGVVPQQGAVALAELLDRSDLAVA